MCVSQFIRTCNNLIYQFHICQISDYHYIPDTPRMSERLRVCLQEGDEVLSYANNLQLDRLFFLSEISLSRFKQSQDSVLM